MPTLWWLEPQLESVQVKQLWASELEKVMALQEELLALSEPVLASVLERTTQER